MSTRIAASRYAASVAPAAPAGSTWLPSDWSNARPFALCLTGAVLVFLARIHEVLPPLGKLYPAKLIAVPLVATAIIGLRRDLFKRALQLTPVRCVLLIAALAVLSVPGSVYPRNSFMFLTGPFFRFLILFVLVAAGFGDRRIFKSCIIALVVGVTLAAGRALLGWNGGWDAGRFAIGGTYDPNASASLFVLTIPFALYLASRGGIWQLIGFGSSLVLAAATLKTGSRGGMLGLAVITPWLLYLAPRQRRLLYIVGVAIGATFIVVTMSDAQRARFATIFASNDYNMTFREGRIEVWKRGLRYMATHPFLGVGVDGFQVAEGTLAGKVNEGYGIGYTAAHNSFVQIGAELGVGGLITFLVMWATSAMGAWRVRAWTLRRAAELPHHVADQEIGLANASIGALIGTAATGFFLSLAYDPIVLFIVAACAGLVVGSPLGGMPVSRAAAPQPQDAAPPTGARGWRSARFKRQPQTRGNRRVGRRSAT